MPGRLGAFFAELRRRHVYQVAAVYVAVGLGVLGAAELILDPLGLGAARPFIVVITLLGFPIAVVLAWAYEKTPEGRGIPLRSTGTGSRLRARTLRNGLLAGLGRRGPQ